jgi:hypothetical protein
VIKRRCESRLHIFERGCRTAFNYLVPRAFRQRKTNPLLSKRELQRCHLYLNANVAFCEGPSSTAIAAFHYMSDDQTKT